MSFQLCGRCLTKTPTSPNTSTSLASIRRCFLNATPVAAFSSTSASLQSSLVKKKQPPHKPREVLRGTKQNFTKKGKKVDKIDRGRRPEIGERKALRKRIVLSNTNALEVSGLTDLSAESMIDERRRGQVLGIPGEVVDRLRALEAFKVTQGWPLFRRPAMLVRKETVDYGQKIEAMSEEGAKKTARRVLVGEQGGGKTLMLLQAMTMALLKGWVVINIPEGDFPKTYVRR